MSRAQRYIDQARGFTREYTHGLRARDLRHLFEREASQAYKVLTRDQVEAEPRDELRRVFHRIKIIFLGISYKLTPPRRILFVACLALTLVGLLGGGAMSFVAGESYFELDFSPIWFLAAIIGLLYLLAVELVDRIRVRDELEVARQLQSELLPTTDPEIAGYSFAHSYRTANEVGGDYYDFLPVAGDRVAVVVGDASGHGIAAGLLMAIANATLKTAIDLDPDPQAVVSLMNRTLCRTGDRRAFLTLFYALLTPHSGRIDYVCAGHPFPLHRRAGGDIRELGEGALPLGIRPDATYQSHTTVLEEGDLLLLYTDGLAEAIDRDGTAFGFDRIQRLVERVGTPAVVHDRILLAFDEHIAGEPVQDDVTLVAMTRRLPENRPPSEKHPDDS